MLGTENNKSNYLWKFSEDLIDICILGAMCLLCSLPIVTMGASAAAMYTVFMNHSIYGKKELVKPFFSAFKENFKKATILWLITFPAMLILAVDAFYYLFSSDRSIFFKIMVIFMLCLLAIVIVVSAYAFPTMVLYNNTVRETLIKSFKYSYISWPWTLLIFVVSIAFPILMIMGLWYFAFLFAGITGYVNTHIMIKVFNPIY